MLQIICDWIILIGAVVGAIVAIYNFLLRPTKFFQKRNKDKQRILIREVLKEELPNSFLEHDLETRDKYLADRKRYLNEIKNEVESDLNSTLLRLEAKYDEQSQRINEQNRKSDERGELLKAMSQGTKDILRQKIMAIYFANKHQKRLSTYDKECLTELYKDYKSQGGNSYIDKYHARMLGWEIDDSDDTDDLL